MRVVRQVGQKKDQYYIDGKMVPRAEVRESFCLGRSATANCVSSGSKLDGVSRLLSIKPLLYCQAGKDQ